MVDSAAPAAWRAKSVSVLPVLRFSSTTSNCALQVNRLPALAAGHLTFASFSRTNKIGDATMALWSRGLRALPQSWLIVPEIAETRTEQRLRAAFSGHGVAAKRIDFRPHMSPEQYLALRHEVDVALDTFPFTGQTTTQQALWMAVPVLTRTGRTLHQNHGAAILEALGMSD